jgi:release factor glutamine methyltransferase
MAAISSHDNSPSTVEALLERSTRELFRGGIESPRLVAELLLTSVMKLTRREFQTFRKMQVVDSRREEFEVMLRRVLRHEPVQYVIGETEFMGLRFFVDSSVLVPRPETELLVEEVLNHCRSIPHAQLRVLDIGTGSGNIAVSIAYSLKRVIVDAIDVSEKAVAMASKNAFEQRVGGRVHCYMADVFNDKSFRKNVHYDVIVANPPYIPIAEYFELPKNVKMYEPEISLTDGGDGLSFYFRIADLGRALLKENGRLMMEVGHDQAPKVKEILSKKGYSDIRSTFDYGKIERILSAAWSH